MNKKALLLALLCAASLSSCGGSAPSSSESLRDVTINVINRHSKAVSGVELKIGENTATTGADGKAVFSLKGSEKSSVTASNLPSGYIYDSPLEINEANEYTITLDSTLIEGTIARGTNIGIGDLAYNYSFTTIEYGESENVVEKTITLKEQLEKFDFICINMFFFSCSACTSEAPHIRDAYKSYQDQCYMIGIDQVDLGDSNEKMAQFKEDEGFTFDLAYDYPRLTNGFGTKNFPTTVIIDRYGFVCFYFASSFISAKELEDVFASFAGENYEPCFYKKNSLTKE